jgi:hydrogenase-4 membrane subunit HyfE
VVALTTHDVASAVKSSTTCRDAFSACSRLIPAFASSSAASFIISDALPLPNHPENQISNLLIPTALSTVLIGQLILVSRTLALTQVLGYSADEVARLLETGALE